MNYNLKQLSNLYEEEKNKSQTARAYCKLHGIKYTDTIRRKISGVLESLDSVDVKEIPVNEEEVKSDTSSNNYKQDKTFVLSAWNEQGHMMDIDEYCEHYTLPRKDISSYKLVSHTGTPFYNIVFKENVVEGDLDYENKVVEKVKELISEKSNLPKFEKKDIEKSDFDLCCITDVHIGMNPNPNGFSLFGGEWNKDELFRRGQILLNHIINTKTNDNLVFFDLGDYLDGWDGETVRKGHHLPQNMTNEEAFDVAFDFKVWLFSELSSVYKQIDVVNIVDDNHSGSFAYVVNKPLKTYLEHVLGNVEFKIQRKFINHYIYNDKCFIATHGKDGVNLKFGFKPILDNKQIEKIDNYISEHDLHKYDIYFIKGDSHQDIFDNSTSQKFKYWNFPAFSPSSNWVQTNFKKGISGFYTINFKENTYTLNPYYFKWKK